MKKNIEFKNLAEAAAKAAGMLLRKNLSKKHSISYKGRKNLVTEMDKKKRGPYNQACA